MDNLQQNHEMLHKLLNIAKQRKPNFNNILKVLNNERPNRPTLFEFFLNDNMYEELANKSVTGLSFHEYNILKMEAYRNSGFDFFTLSYPKNMLFETKSHKTGESISLNDTAIITNIDDFNKYNWPDINKSDLTYITKIEKVVPKGMKAIAYCPGGLLENVMQLIGYDNMCYLLYDDKQFLELVFNKVGQILLDFYKAIVDFDIIGAFIVNDDWGFNTQTMMAFKDMKQYVIPWHKKIVEVIHKSSKKAILHSCGNLDSVMDIIIDDIKYDAKHSFEDNIITVEDAYQKWGDRIAILGGIDLDFIYNKNNKDIAKRAKNLLKITNKKGGYALGTGNSVPHYIENEKYYALILTALETH